MPVQDLYHLQGRGIGDDNESMRAMRHKPLRAPISGSY